MPIQPLERIGDGRTEFQPRRIIQVPSVPHDGAVPVEDHDLSGRAGYAHDTGDWATRLTVSVVLCPDSNSARTTLPPRPITASAPTTASMV